MSLPFSMADFVPCDRLLQKAYSYQSEEEIFALAIKTILLEGWIIWAWISLHVIVSCRKKLVGVFILIFCLVYQVASKFFFL